MLVIPSVVVNEGRAKREVDVQNFRRGAAFEGVVSLLVL